jgi:hypothetical protein
MNLARAADKTTVSLSKAKQRQVIANSRAR